MIDSPALGWGVHIDRVEIKGRGSAGVDEAVDVAPSQGRA
jgi:hypothetical protein